MVSSKTKTVSLFFVAELNPRWDEPVRPMSFGQNRTPPEGVRAGPREPSPLVGFLQ